VSYQLFLWLTSILSACITASRKFINGHLSVWLIKMRVLNWNLYHYVIFSVFYFHDVFQLSSGFLQSTDPPKQNTQTFPATETNFPWLLSFRFQYCMDLKMAKTAYVFVSQLYKSTNLCQGQSSQHTSSHSKQSINSDLVHHLSLTSAVTVSLPML